MATTVPSLNGKLTEIIGALSMDYADARHLLKLISRATAARLQPSTFSSYPSTIPLPSARTHLHPCQGSNQVGSSVQVRRMYSLGTFLCFDIESGVHPLPVDPSSAQSYGTTNRCNCRTGECATRQIYSRSSDVFPSNCQPGPVRHRRPVQHDDSRAGYRGSCQESRYQTQVSTSY